MPPYTLCCKPVRLGMILLLVQFLLQVNLPVIPVSSIQDHAEYFVSASMPLTDCLRIEPSNKPYQALGQREWSVAETVVPTPETGSRPIAISPPLYRSLLIHHTASHLRI